MFGVVGSVAKSGSVCFVDVSVQLSGLGVGNLVAQGVVFGYGDD